MLCRVADNIFWMGRYVERAISVGRLVDVTWHLELDAGDPEDAARAFWLPLLGPGYNVDGATSHTIRTYLSLDTSNPSSMVSCVRSARAAAQQVRESISSEMWEQINALHQWASRPQIAAEVEQDPHAFYRRIREGAQFFQGLADSTLARDEPWDFLTLGTYLERADNVARLLDLQAYLLNLDPTAGADAAVRWLAVLRSCGSAEAYASFYSVGVQPARVLEFLLLNPIFPQSVRFSLATARDALDQLGGQGGLSTGGASSAVSRAMARLCARLDTTAIDEVLEEGLETFLHDVHTRIDEVAEQVTRAYLRDQAPASKHTAIVRAALILAAQQQQQ